MSQKATTDALDGKLDIPSFSGEQLVRYNVMTGTVMGVPFNNAAQAYAVPVRDANGNFKVGTPQADGDVTSKKYVDDGLATRLPFLKDAFDGAIGNFLLYAQNAKGELSYRLVSQRNYDYYVPWFRKPEECGATDDGCTIAVTIPVNPYNATPKKWVEDYTDRKCRDLQQGVYNALGAQYVTVEDTSTSDLNQIPEGAMPFAYFESLGDIVVYGHDGKVIANTAEVTGIYLLGEGGNQTDIDMNSLPTFFEIPNGCDRIMLSLRIPEDKSGLMSHFEIKGKKIIYQVKVGA